MITIISWVKMKLLKDPSLSEYKQDNPPSNKRQKLDLPKKQVPKSLNEYKPYENVLETAKTISWKTINWL